MSQLMQTMVNFFTVSNDYATVAGILSAFILIAGIITIICALIHQFINRNHLQHKLIMFAIGTILVYSIYAFQAAIMIMAIENEWITYWVAALELIAMVAIETALLDIAKVINLNK